jgi:DNA polymerase III subunit delta'
VRDEAEHKSDSEAVGLGARRCRDAEGVRFERLIEQTEAKRLLDAALAEGPAHAYLFHGPAGVGKRVAALAFAGELLDDRERVERRAHPDLYVLEPLGDQIRIDEVRELRRDLHMRPFEAGRRVYLVFRADLLNAEAADALLKDLEEPPPYAVVVLVADELGPLPETIRSRCQLVPFRRLSERAIREEIDRRAPGLGPEHATALARVAAGRLDRVERLLDPDAARRREELLAIARAVYSDPAFDPTAAAQAVLALAAERAAEARSAAEEAVAVRELPDREADQYVRRAERGAEREEILLALEELATWYRDLVVVSVGAERAVIHFDRLAELTEDSGVGGLGAEEAAEAVREAWRAFEEFNVSPPLALEALFVRLRRALAAAPMSP